MAEGFGRGPDGVEIIYAYASDKLRGKLGDLSVFQRAFGNELYAPLLSDHELVASAPTVIGDSARAEVRAFGTAGNAVYQVGMVRPVAGSRAGRWTLSGLFREGADL